MHTVVIAPDSFKGSLDAAAVAEAIGEGWRSIRPDDRLVLLPQADGGEGTLDAILAATPEARLHSAGTVTGPDGRLTEGVWLELPDGAAVVELAQMSGLPLMRHLDPTGSSTRGLGETIAAALDAGAEEVVIGLGGSASTDGGAGALAALGLRLHGAEGGVLPDGGGALAHLHDIDASEMRAAPARGVRLLSDVTAPLLGATGAAAVFGPQKGADEEQVAQLDAALTRFAERLGAGADSPGAGAAGGTGYGFIAAWDARVESGADALADLTGLSSALGDADILITGEGRFDATSLTGKVVGAALARATGIRSIVIAGQVAEDPAEAVGGNVFGIGLTDLAPSVDDAIRDPATWLRAAAAEAARRVSADR
ncbi:MAG: glycerate kinase [Microbacteriaceae bacterium]